MRFLVAVLLSLLLSVGAVGDPTDMAPDETPTTLLAGETIQQAIDRLPKGGILHLKSGTYSGNLVIENSLTLIGPEDGTAEIVGTAHGSVIRILGTGISVRLKNLTIRGARGYDTHGVQIEGSAIVELTHVVLTDNAWSGLNAADRADVHLVECRLIENGTSGTLTEDFSRLRLERCEVSNNVTHGVHTWHYSEVEIVDSVISGNWTGIWAWDATRVSISASNLADNIDYGAIASNAALLVLEDSIVSGNGHHGILLEESSRGILRSTHVSHNGADGLHMQQDGFLEAYDCVFEANAGAGLRVSIGRCIGGFNAKLNFNGRIRGARNKVGGPDEESGNNEMALCPRPPETWPAGFLLNE